MPDLNDTGGARQCSRVAARVQVCRLPLLHPLWLNRWQDWIRSCVANCAARPQEAT
jgi:hypothetical protein